MDQGKQHGYGYLMSCWKNQNFILDFDFSLQNCYRFWKNQKQCAFFCNGLAKKHQNSGNEFLAKWMTVHWFQKFWKFVFADFVIFLYWILCPKSLIIVYWNYNRFCKKTYVFGANFLPLKKPLQGQFWGFCSFCSFHFPVFILVFIFSFKFMKNKTWAKSLRNGTTPCWVLMFAN